MQVYTRKDYYRKKQKAGNYIKNRFPNNKKKLNQTFSDFNSDIQIAGI